MLNDGLVFSDKWVFRFSSASRGSSSIQILDLVIFLLQIDWFYDKEERGYGEKRHTRQ
jgi:hypothetical protein